MKRFFAVMLTVLAAAAFAAETAVELKKNIILGWGSQTYYKSAPKVTVADGVAKVEVSETVEGAKPSRYQFGVLCKQTFKAGTAYTFTFTLKSNKAVTGGDVNFQLSGKPYTIFKRIPLKLNADEAKTFTLTYTPKEDITAPTRTPGLHFVMEAGQTVELSDVKIAEAAAE